MKTRKIGIRFTLQQNFGIKITPKDGEIINQLPEVEKFTVYVQVTYNRKNTKFRFDFNEYTKEEFLSAKYQHILKDVEQKIKSIIEMEVAYLGEKFSLKGLGKRFEKYNDSVSKGIYSVITSILYDKLELMSDFKNATAKEMFFYYSIVGSRLIISLDEKIQGSKELHNLTWNIEQIGSMLFERNTYNVIFNSDMKDLLAKVNNLFYDNASNEAMLDNSIINWLDSSYVLGNKKSVIEVYSLIWSYLNE